MASGRIVAELGRPETPEETAARKARESRQYRERKTVSNLIAALLATLIGVAVIVLAVPRPDAPIDRSVNAQQVARDAVSVLGATALVPNIQGTVNVAEVRTSADNVVAWNLGWVTPSNQFIGMMQSTNANPTWVSKQFGDTAPTGSTTIGGVDWVVTDNRTAGTEVGNARYGVTTEFVAADGSTQTVLVFGTATEAEMTRAIAAVAASILAVK
ncbi:MAG TPA: DUF4245 family protein [Microbacteriaceae bacterium]|nr:DUF4245 family protein [Microbacteriaceae bacterium]